jgi:formylglycine-generating enzyme required for sulfatase activity
MKSCFKLIAILILFSIPIYSIAGEAEKDLIKDASKYLFSPSDKQGEEGMQGILDYSKRRIVNDTENAKPNQISCPKCNRVFPEEFNFCPYDGTRLSGHLSENSSIETNSGTTVSGNSITNSLGMKFIFIPPGSFLMGSPIGESHRKNNELQHKVTISKGFYIGESEVTIGQWIAITGEHPFTNPKSKWGKENYPAMGISWYQVQKYIKKLNLLDKTKKYRLPTEAEWEYACRAGSEDAYSWGDVPNCDKANYGNFHGDARKQRRCVKHISSMGLAPGPVPVKNFPPNAWGLYDMHGNVYEWVQDYIGNYSDQPQINPTGPSAGRSRVIRGGYWGTYAFQCRSAERSSYTPDSKIPGFRLILMIKN